MWPIFFDQGNLIEEEPLQPSAKKPFPEAPEPFRGLCLAGSPHAGRSLAVAKISFNPVQFEGKSLQGKVACESRRDLIQIKAEGVIRLQSPFKPRRKPLAGHRRFILFARFLEGPVPHCFNFLPDSPLSGLFCCRTVLQCRMVKLRAGYLFDAGQGRSSRRKGYGGNLRT